MVGVGSDLNMGGERLYCGAVPTKSVGGIDLVVFFTVDSDTASAKSIFKKELGCLTGKVGRLEAQATVGS